MEKYVLVLPLLLLLSGCISAPGIQQEAGAQIKAELVLRNLVPEADVQGSDIESVPRPNGFVRAEYSREDWETDITYRARGDRFDEAYSFYREEMPKRGWKLAGESREPQSEISYMGYTFGVEKDVEMDYRKENYEEAQINIRVIVIGKEKVTEININYFPPEEESGEEEAYKPLNREPYAGEVERYSGAVLFDQSMIQVGEIRQYTDKYHVDNARVEDVFNFYSNLQIPGYRKMTSELEGESAYIYFSGNNSGIGINIEKEGDGVIIEVMKQVR